MRGDNLAARAAWLRAAGLAIPTPSGKQTMNLRTVRRVWAAVSRNPGASLDEIAAAAGFKSKSSAHMCLAILEEAGYIASPIGKARARRVLVPFLEVTP